MPLPKILTVLVGSLAWESLFRNLGGTAIVFRATHTLIFGKTIRTFEYPQGVMKTFTIRLSSVDSLKKRIAEKNHISPSDIKKVYRYEDYYWTEPLETAADVRSLKDHNMVLWSRSFAKIPSRGVNMKELPQMDQEEEGEENLDEMVDEVQMRSKQRQLRVNMIQYIMQQGRKSHLGEKALTDDQVVMLTELVLDDDPYLISLYKNLKSEPERFIKHAKKFVEEVRISKEEPKHPLDREQPVRRIQKTDHPKSIEEVQQFIKDQKDLTRRDAEDADVKRLDQRRDSDRKMQTPSVETYT